MPAGLPGTEYLDPLYQDRLAAERKRAIADQLAAQAAQPLDSGGTVYRGRAPAPLHWSQTLAKIFAAVMANRQDKKATEAETGLAGKRLEGAKAAEDAYNANRTQMPEVQLPPRTRFENGAETVVQGPTLEGIGDTSQAAPVAMGDMFATPELKARAQVELAMAERDRARQEAQNYQLGRDRRSDIETRANREMTLAAQREAKLRDEALRRDLASQADQTRRDLANQADQTRRDLDARDAIADKEKADKKVNPGQAAVDRTFGADYATYVTGGAAAVQQSIDELTKAADDLPNTNASGPILGLVPAIGRSVIAPEGFGIQQDIERNIQSSLRQVLGAQYTQVEGENLLSRTFNPRLDEKINQERLVSLVTRIKRAKEEKDRAAEYFRVNGTLAGYSGKTGWSLNEFDVTKGAEPKSASAPGGAPTTTAPAADPDKERRYQEWKRRQK